MNASKSVFTRFRKVLLTSVTLSSVLLCKCALAQWLVPKFNAEVVRSYPHDVDAFTQGLFFLNGFLYESTGLAGHSSLRKVKLETGAVIQKHDVEAQYFAEGIVNWKKEIFGLTYKSQIGFIYDLDTFKVRRQFSYVGEGWGLTQDGSHIIMSDGTEYLRFLNPRDLRQISRLKVTYEGKPLININELEWIEGEIYANVWLTNHIVRIHPKTGVVLGLIDLSSISRLSGRSNDAEDVLNGIAYDSARKRLFVTGKRWQRVFEIRLIPVRRP
ncbi:MAG TPA: glutaminyl-peptide cyclotransferase [Steroidobacteraceae bacterium]|nr:glutaminyl-peptide cyclotransferase [Steroidobacteraceae bacterium]